MARQKKNSKNELDTILEQLKKSYGDESSESLEDELFKSSQSEEDSELNDILNRIFSSEEQNEEARIDDTNVNSQEIDFIPEPEVTVAESGSALPEENTDAENQVDNILNIMFTAKDSAESFGNDDSAKNSESVNGNDPSKQIEIIHEAIETSVSENDSKVSENDFDEICETSVQITSEIHNKHELTHEIDDIITEEADDSSCTIDIVTEVTEDNNCFDEKSEKRIYISANVKNNLDVESKSYETEEVSEDDNIDDNLNETKSENQVPRINIVLDRSHYTFDPLQEELPHFIISKDKTINISSNNINENDYTLQDTDTSKLLDSNDISLLLKLGYDDEVINAVGKEKTQEILLEKDHLFVPESHRKPFGFGGKEFCDRSQIDSIKNRYKTNKRNIIISFSLVALISLAIFALNFFFEFFSNRVSSFPAVVLFELIFVTLLCLAIHKKLIRGAIGILKFETDLYSLLTFLILIYILYDAFAIIAYFVNESVLTASDLMLFGAPIAVYSLLILATDLANCSRESKTFGMMASVDSFYIAEKQNTAQLSKFGEAADDKTVENTYRIRKTSLVSGYFKKMSQSRINSVNLIYILGIVPTISVIVGCCCLLLGDSFLRCASSMLLCLMLCVPFSYIFIPSFVEYIVSSKLNKQKIAFIGTEAVTEYALTKNLIFKDIDSIEIISCSEIQPNKRSIIQSDVEIAHKVFKALSGPLSKIKDSSDADITYDRSEVIINDIQDNGIEIYFKSSINILLGDKAYMHSHNIKVKTDTNLNAATKGADRSVIYIAYDGIPKLGFIVNSKIKNDFSNIADLVEKNGIHIFVETYEPQINDQYYEQNKNASLANVNVIKPQTFENDDENQSGNGGLISVANSVSLAQAICASKKITEYRKQNRFLNILISVIGGVFACLFIVLTSTLNYLPFFEFLRLHTSLIFNIIMLSAMTPGIVRLIKLHKNDSIIK
mgnify:CR=1 FL=1